MAVIAARSGLGAGSFLLIQREAWRQTSHLEAEVVCPRNLPDVPTGILVDPMDELAVAVDHLFSLDGGSQGLLVGSWL